jgi:hypothetical protein
VIHQFSVLAPYPVGFNFNEESSPMHVQTRERYVRLHDDYRDLSAALEATTDKDDRRIIRNKLTAVEQERQRLDPPATTPLR